MVYQPTYSWQRGKDASQIHLYYGGRQVGTWHYGNQMYYPFDGSRWGNPKYRWAFGAPEPPPERHKPVTALPRARD